MGKKEKILDNLEDGIGIGGLHYAKKRVSVKQSIEVIHKNKRFDRLYRSICNKFPKKSNIDIKKMIIINIYDDFRDEWCVRNVRYDDYLLKAKHAEIWLKSNSSISIKNYFYDKAWLKELPIYSIHRLDHLPKSFLGRLKYAGNWDASSTFEGRVLESGSYYNCSEQGSKWPDGSIAKTHFDVGDFAIYTGSGTKEDPYKWEKSSGPIFYVTLKYLPKKYVDNILYKDGYVTEEVYDQITSSKNKNVKTIISKEAMSHLKENLKKTDDDSLLKYFNDICGNKTKLTPSYDKDGLLCWYILSRQNPPKKTEAKRIYA